METGGGQTFVAHSAAGALSEAVGQFPGSASLGISETGARGDNDFSLQLNAKQFTTAACTPPGTTAKSDDCQGWQQFIYSNYAHGVYTILADRLLRQPRHVFRRFGRRGRRLLPGGMDYLQIDRCGSRFAGVLSQ